MTWTFAASAQLRPVWVAVAALILVAAVTPAVRWLALRLKIVAFPKEDRWHRRPIPMLGGIAIFIGTLGAVLLFGAPDRTVVPLIVCGAGMFALGLLDDFLGMTPSSKLTGQIIVACVAIALGGGPHWTGWGAPDALLGILWIVLIANAVNLLDNMDGLAAGVTMIVALACWLNLIQGNPAASVYAAALAGASAGFLLFNFKPASIFMGDGGSLFLGGSIAVLASSGAARAEAGVLSTIAVPVFLLLLPLFDTMFVTLSRILSTRSAAQGGRDHTSHRLVAMGFSERQAVLILYGLASVGAATAVLGGVADLHFAVLMGPLAIIGLALLGLQLARVRVYDGEDFSLLTNRSYTPLLIDLAYKRRVFEVALDLVLVTVAYYAAYVIRFDRDLPIYYQLFAESLPIIIGCQMCSFFVAGVYRGTWRYLGVGDLSTYAKGVGLGVLSSVMVLVYLYRFEGYSRGVFVIDGMAIGLLLIGSRISFRVVAEAAGRRRQSGTPTLIYGAGDAGALLIRELRNNLARPFRPIGFVDDDLSKRSKRILGLPIFGGLEEVAQVIGREQVQAVVVSTTKLEAARLGELRRICYASGTQLLQLRFSLEETHLTAHRDQTPTA